ncbi:hypothetical protein GCM10007973_19390 [Polymorphobacter multimanifer]|nr:hypothetical protein GCM10007973_19390 [Polymorphobacter multimanifer]
MALKLRAYGYVRVSVDEEDGKNASIASQNAAIDNYCEVNDIEKVHVFEEPNVSGRKLARKQFDRMIDAATQPGRPVDMIISYALSRFSRRMYTQVVSFAKLDQAGVDFVSLTEAFSNDATGQMMRGVVGLMNEKYAQDAAQFTRRDRRRNALRGFFNGGNIVFGYESRTVQTDGKKERKKLFVVDEEAATVRLIYDMAEFGTGAEPMGTRSIAEWLRVHGYTLRGGQFFHSSIDRILTQPHYLGRYPDRTKDDAGKLPTLEDQTYVECPRIIEPEQAARVAALRAKRAPAVTAPRVVNGPTMLTGIAACGMPGCRSGLTISTGKGGRYSYYKCASKVNGGAARCNCPTLPMKTLDDIVLRAVEDRVLDPGRLQALLSGILEISNCADARRKTDLDQARKARTRCETAIGRLIELIEEGLMSAKDPEFAKRMSERRIEKARLDATISGLERQMIRGAKRITPEIVEKFGGMVAAKLRDPDPKLRKAYVRLLVDRVEVNASEIRIIGSKSALEHAVLDPQVAAGRVPSFDREWCPEEDSNLHALASAST